MLHVMCERERAFSESTLMPTPRKDKEIINFKLSPDFFRLFIFLQYRIGMKMNQSQALFHHPTPPIKGITPKKEYYQTYLHNALLFFVCVTIAIICIVRELNTCVGGCVEFGSFIYRTATGSTDSSVIKCRALIRCV